MYCRSSPFIAPARSAGASYSETGVSNDPSVRPSDVRDEKLNGQNIKNICVGHAVLLFALFELSIFKVPKKSAFAR
jgi:hypothetical protein